MTNEAHLPSNIRRQIEEADALERQLYGEQAPAEGNTDASEQDTEPGVDEVQAEAHEPAQVEQPAQSRDEEELYQRRYDVLRGKYDAEVPRLSHQVKELTQQLQQAMYEMQQLRQAPQPVAKDEPDNDAETFGEDLVEAVDRRAERKARTLVTEQTAELKQYIQQLEARLGNVNQQVATSAQDQFYSKLGQMVPDYEAVNTNQGFLNWLGESDPVYGVPRQASLDAAAQSMDVGRVAAIFQAYKQLTGNPVVSQHKQQARQELERQVAPSKSQATQSVSPQGKIWSRAEFEHAYDPRTIRELGQIRADALVADAEQALAEGRVRF